jgi:bacterioferritin-associated ferredoxin
MSSSTDQELTAKMQDFCDNKEISDRLGVWCRCADTREMERMSEVFDEDIEWDFGGGTVDRGLQAVIDRITAHVGAASNCGQRQIHLANLRVDVTGDVAQSEAYFFSVSAGIGPYDGQALLQWGNYLDSWERGAQGWRIVKRQYENRIDIGPMDIVYATAPTEMWQEGDARHANA